MKIVVLGLSITSSWGNGHATTYRGLLRELAARGHEVQFLERNQPWYADNRDLVELPGVAIKIYASLAELQRYHLDDIREADAVIVGSYVPDGAAVGEWVLENAGGLTAFYDIDTPITLANLRCDGCAYLEAAQIARYRLYLSFTGGPTLEQLEGTWGSPMARPLYCAVDPRAYYSEARTPRWDLGYLGTYSADRQPGLERLMFASARRMPPQRFVVAGPQYPDDIDWPANIERVVHLPPSRHRRFYNEQRFTLNLTRADMVAAGWSPSVRLFEAAACGTPIISDYWPGLEDFFAIGSEILLATTPDDVARILRDLPEDEAAAIGQTAQRRVLERHTAAHRAMELEAYLFEAVRLSRTDSAFGHEPLRSSGDALPFTRRTADGVYAAAAKRSRANLTRTFAP
jgi:spore maturation protein CgeB